MQPIDDTQLNSRKNRVRSLSKEQGQDLAWLEVVSQFIFWVGICGSILVISQSAWSDNNTHRGGGFAPGAPPSNPFARGSHTGGDQNRGIIPHDNYFEDDDEDDFGDDSAFPPAKSAGPSHSTPPSHSTGGGATGLRSGGQSPSFSPPGPRSFSAGGSSNNTPDPVLTDEGIAVGGSAANGVVSKSKVPVVKIDSETAEGSKDIITDFNFPDADILDIAKTLGKLTGKNFIFDKDVKGRVTIVSNSPITVGEAWKVFLTALDINQFALIPSGKYLRIARQRDARDKQLKTYTGDFSPDTDALITRVFPLKYISADEVARNFRNFMPANSRIINYDQTNTVIVTDTGSNIAKLAKMLEILDVEGYDAGIEVVPVKYASAAELSKLIDALIPGTATAAPGGGPGGGPRFGGGPGGGAGSRFSARRTKEGGIINTVIADERTNSLIVHANTKGADQVRELVAKLDLKQPTSTGGGKVHVVYLQFAEAEQLANTLNNFSSQANTRSSSPGGGAPGGGTGGTGTNPIATTLFEGAIKISPDKATNSLVITASPSDFAMINRVISKLDVPRDQVYVEVIIMEVHMGNNFTFSANVASAPSLIGSITSAQDVAGVTSLDKFFSSEGAILSFAAGNNYTTTIGGQTVTLNSLQGLVKALQTNSSGNILATPQVIALDNSEATFESADKIPVPTLTQVQGVGASTSFTKEPIAISIKIKPQINKVTNFVKLDVTAKLGDISSRTPPKAVADQALATLDRSVTTSVVVGDTDTVVLGGLVNDKINETTKKIPILGDIPLLGWLFKSKITEVNKLNLLIFMTPHIVRQYEKVRTILDKKLRERDEFIEANNGGNDPLRSKRDDMIRSLPNLKELTEKKPQTTFTIDEEKGGIGVIPSSSGTNSGTNSGSSATSVPPTSPISDGAPALNPEDRVGPNPNNGDAAIAVPVEQESTNISGGSTPPQQSQ